MTYVIIRDGIVENVVEWDGDPAIWQPPEGAQAVEYEGRVSPGWSWVDGAPIEPSVPPLSLADRKRAMLAMVAAELSWRNAVGFSYQGKTYQLDDASQARITGLTVKADRFVSGAAGATWGGQFIAADNSETIFSAMEFGAFADAAANVVIARRLHARDLKNQIVAAADEVSLDAIDLAAGWQ